MNKYIILLLLSNFLLALAPIFSNIGVPLKGSLIYSFYDLFAAGIIILLFSKITRKKLVFSKKFVKNGLIYFLGTFFFFKSFNYLSSITASFIAQAQIIFTLIISYFLLNEKIGTKKLFSALLVIIGGFVIYYHEKMNFNDTGIILMVTATIFFAFLNYRVKKLRKEYDSLSIMFYQIVTVTTILFIINLFTNFNQLFTIDKGNFYALLQGLSVDFLGWYLFIISLKHVELNKAFIIYSLNSLITLAYSFMIFGIEIIILQLIGGLFIIVGNIIYNTQ